MLTAFLIVAALTAACAAGYLAGIAVGGWYVHTHWDPSGHRCFVCDRQAVCGAAVIRDGNRGKPMWTCERHIGDASDILNLTEGDGGW